MKKLVVLGIVMTIAGLAMAQPQKKTFTARVKTRPAPTPPPIKKENTDGVLPRAARGGNPFQMLNPKAPPQYGRAEDSVVLDPDTGKWKGIKLFTINF
ncbi:MAG: hypothetical protein DME35_05700 [Verrucomicrobia bacterium]|nr:MAG: hypothetical protein DME35_05700 [Verrucomicrobiota bacterium]PYL28421.1 MAG: hypothetical protein DMF45_09280 [Verrucomicrobiota bacterium]